MSARYGIKENRRGCDISQVLLVRNRTIPILLNAFATGNSLKHSYSQQTGPNCVVRLLCIQGQYISLVIMMILKLLLSVVLISDWTSSLKSSLVILHC